MQNQRQGLVQEQRLKMNPQLVQSIQLMALPLQELKFRIQQELERNPALEVVEDPGTTSLEEAVATPEEYEYFENSSDPGFTTSSYDQNAGDSKRRFMEGALARPESLQEHLLWQLRLQPISETAFEIGELLIRNLDENGFDLEDPMTLVKPGQQKELERIRAMIQSFEPVGTCVRDYRESLIIQARLAEDRTPSAEEILANYFTALEKGRYSEITRKLKISREQLDEEIAFIRSLTPFPGRLYSNESPTYVIPDLLVTIKEGQLVIILNEEEIPVLGIDPFFDALVEDVEQRKDKQVKRFVTNSVKDARWFIHSIQQRNQTLLKVARAVVEFQREFFIRGPKYLVPLTLRDIAAEVGVHEATVSRITTGKYMQTEWGIFELKYFFSNAVSTTAPGGRQFSKEAVKENIKEILEQESGDTHLSDQKIAALLEQRGIKIARRTVAKYRRELDISSSYDR